MIHPALALEAPAKLNLGLGVVGRRDDGLHELDSVLVLLELADRALLLPGCSGLRVDPPGELPLDATNLAWRGLLAGLGEEPALSCLSLEKAIPVSAGLGGGSSDAAAAWRLGRHARGLGPPTAGEVAGLAAIGADVPFFAAGVAAARVAGVGERVAARPAPDPALEIVLAVAPFGLATGEVFAALRPDEHGGPLAEGETRNDLLAAARRLRPELDDLSALVAGAGGEPRLSGSGPTLFTAGDDPERADAIAARIERAGARAIRTRTRRAPAEIVIMGEAKEDA